MDFRLLRAAKELAKTRKVDTLRFIVFIGQYTLLPAVACKDRIKKIIVRGEVEDGRQAYFLS